MHGLKLSLASAVFLLACGGLFSFFGLKREYKRAAA